MAPKDGGLLFWIGGVSVSDAEKATLAKIGEHAWNVKPEFAREAQARA